MAYIVPPVQGQQITLEDWTTLINTVNELQEEVFGDRELMERKPAVKKAFEQYQFVKNLSKDHT